MSDKIKPVTIDSLKAARIIDYALCFLNANWDENIEESLEYPYEEFETFVRNFQSKLDKARKK
jgi:hypothetical protein